MRFLPFEIAGSFPTRILVWLTLLAGVLAGVFWTDAEASTPPAPMVNIKAYVSASGRYSLEVDPTEPYARGPGRYRMEIDGKEAWRATLPFTLYDAVVANDGTVVGYSYEYGIAGFALDRERSSWGHIHVVVLDRDGKLRLHESNKRGNSVVLGEFPRPRVRTILLNETADQFSLHLDPTFSNDEIDSNPDKDWWTYRLSTGEALGKFEIRVVEKGSTNYGTIKNVKTVLSTPFSLVHWWSEDQSGDQGAMFQLIDATGRSVWTKELPRDYTIPGNEKAEQELRGLVDEKGAILDTSKDGQFELLFGAEVQRVLFAVKRDENAKNGWRVEEVGRRPFVFPPPVEKNKPEPSLEKRPLKLLGSFKLEGETPKGPVRDVSKFDFDADGRIGIIRREIGGSLTFVLVDREGKAEGEIPLPDQLQSMNHPAFDLAFVGDGRWVIVASEYDNERESWAWWIDVRSKSFSEAERLDCPRVSEVSGTEDGGFVLLATGAADPSHGGGGLATNVYAFDRDAKSLWVIEESNDREPGSLRDAQDILFCNGEIAVLDNSGDKVEFFDCHGKYRHTVDLKKSWGREEIYPTAIERDVNNGFIIEDSSGDLPYVRMNSDGSVRASLRPRYRDGRLADVTYGMRLARDGHLWVSDGHALQRLNDDGVVDRFLGPAVDPERLDDIAKVTGDKNGRVYAVDERTRSIHVFDSEGKKVRVCIPAPEDFPKRLSFSACITVADDGSVFLSDGESENGHRYLHFASDGSRRGFKKFELDTTEQEWFAQPGSDNVLVLGYKGAFLMGPDGKIRVKIDRRADRHWIGTIDTGAVADDGSFAIQGVNFSSGSYSSSGPTVNLYEKDGSSVRTFPLAGNYPQLVGYNGRHVVAKHFNRNDETWVEIYDSGGILLQRFDLPKTALGMFLMREGRELWVVDLLRWTVDRYAMP